MQRKIENIENIERSDTNSFLSFSNGFPGN